MNPRGKLLLLIMFAFVTLCCSSCLIRPYEWKKWNSRPGHAYRYGGRHGQAGRHLWVRDKFRNTH